MNKNHKNIEHRSTVIRINNKQELSFILQWCLDSNKSVTKTFQEWNKFPFGISVSGSQLGFVDRMDRAMYYKPFIEFLSNIGY